jgi:hypothetical protein
MEDYKYVKNTVWCWIMCMLKNINTQNIRGCMKCWEVCNCRLSHHRTNQHLFQLQELSRNRSKTQLCQDYPLFFILGSLCIMNYVYNNQLDTLFYLHFIELRHLYIFQASATNHQEVRSVYVANGTSKTTVSSDSHLRSTICHIHTLYLLMIDRWGLKHVQVS